MQRINYRMCVPAILALCCGFTPLSSSAQKLAFIPSDTGSLGDGGTVAGWGYALSIQQDYIFQVTTPIQVTALAYYYFPGGALPFCVIVNPLANCPVRVSIETVNPTNLDEPGTIIASTSVSLSDPVDHVSTNVDFYHSGIASVTLSPGIDYQMRQAGSGRITFYQSKYSLSPEIAATQSAAYFGGNFYFTSAVPEPASYASLLLGISVMASTFFLRRRSAA